MSPTSSRIFLLSPASLTGVRGRRVLEGDADAPFMEALRRGETVPLGDVYSFISSLYYRGKRAYGRAFARVATGVAEPLVITPTRGLVPDGTPVDLDALRAFATTDIASGEPAFLDALTATARRLDDRLGVDDQVVLLGSIASAKYVEPLLSVFGERLSFPRAFIGRGDMSRGGLLLRCVAEGRELAYVPAGSAPRRGPRPPKLDPGGRPPPGSP